MRLTPLKVSLLYTWLRTISSHDFVVLGEVWHMSHGVYEVPASLLLLKSTPLLLFAHLSLSSTVVSEIPALAAGIGPTGG
jgi:hypothetical protein